ncbi:MAG: hypothetical protein KC646_13550 [Candidatus Cloacimonetes bacterium]|nr:hypothetical protein [Candidatus Cloacimonadota bacterium]
MNNILKVFLLLSVFVGSNFAGAVIIVHKNFPADSISASDLKKIYANKMGQWAHGGTIIRTLLKKGKAHKDFCKRVKKSNSKLKRFWKKQVFTGKGSAPKTFKSDANMIAFIASNEKALGYVDEATDVSGVKVLTIK